MAGLRAGPLRRRPGDRAAPEQFGTRHSTPYPYTQDSAGLLGPGFFEEGSISDDPVTLADVSPTYADLLHFDDWPTESATGPSDALLEPEERETPPKLTLRVVWDGGSIMLLSTGPTTGHSIRN